jgi:hypothetical protein
MSPGFVYVPKAIEIVRATACPLLRTEYSPRRR